MILFKDFKGSGQIDEDHGVPSDKQVKQDLCVCMYVCMYAMYAVYAVYVVYVVQMHWVYKFGNIYG